MSLSTNLQNLATRVATECKSLRYLVNGNAADLSALTTGTKTNLVAAINELQAAVTTLGDDAIQIDDAAQAATTVYSSAKTAALIGALRDEILGPGVAEALNTLQELAAAIGDDANFANTVTNALGKRVRVDAEQLFTSIEKAQARANIGAAAAADIGDTNVNFVTTFETGLA